MTAYEEVLSSLEQWSPRLFLLGAVFELVFAANNGLAFLVEGFSFVDWLYPTVLLGRVAVLFGIAGLSMRIRNQHPRVGRLSQAVLAATSLFTVGLLTLSLLQSLGVTTSIIAVFGLGTVALTVITYGLFGAVILHTGTLPASIGGALLAAALTVLGVFVGLTILPTRLVGGVGEGLLCLLFIAIWHLVRAVPARTERPEPAPNTVAE